MTKLKINKRLRKSLSPFVIIVSVVGAYFVGQSQAVKPVQEACICSDNQVLVTEVIDGDTIRIEGGERVRLLGIDTPEKGECYFAEAKQELSELIDGKVVMLEKDITNRDKYERLLRYVYLEKDGTDNILINDEMVENGFAYDISTAPDNRFRYLLVAARESAKKKKLGLWSACDTKEEPSQREIESGPKDPNCNIKGNISEKGFGKTYLIEGCDNYNRVKIDERKGEAYYCSEEDAVKAGFRKATNCP